MYGSPTPKELKEETLIQTSRRGGDGPLDGEDLWQDSGWRTQRGARLWSRAGKAAAGGLATARKTQGPSVGKLSLKPLAENTCGGWGGSRKKSQPHRRIPWRDPQGPRMYTNPPTWNQHQKGPICLWVVGEVTENCQRVEQAALFPLGPLPHIQHHKKATCVAPPW